MNGIFQQVLYLSLMTLFISTQVLGLIGDSCNGNDSSTCTGIGYQCNNGSCECADGYYSSMNNCLQKEPTKVKCQGNSDCVDLLICGENKTCICNETIQYTLNNQCYSKQNYSENCTARGQCIGNIECINGLCQCEENFYFMASNNQCIIKIEYNGSCNGTNQCTTNLTCTDNKCTCTDNQYYNSMMCLDKIGYNGSCNGTNQCTTNLTCTDNKCTCTDNQYYNSMMCLDKSEYNGICNGTDQCTTNLTCTDNKCTCTDNQYYNSTICVQKVGHGDICSSDEACNLENGGCSTTCLCNPEFYYYNSSCSSISNLKPLNLAVTPEARTVTITWQLDTSLNQFVQNFKIVGFGNNRTAFNMNRTMNVDNLEPGTIYSNILVIAVVTDDRSGSHEVLSDPYPSVETRKVGYGEECTKNESCNVINGSCYPSSGGTGTGTCTCDPNFYTESKECKTVSQLAPSNVSEQDVTTMSFTLTWTAVNNDVITGYRITATPDVNISVAETDSVQYSQLVNNLIPGATYSDITVTALIRTDRGVVDQTARLPSTITTPKISHGDDCAGFETRCNGNMTCITNKCGCEETHYHYNDNCYTKKNYGETCDDLPADECSGSNVSCYQNHCRCNERFYTDTSKNCISVTTLAPTSFKTSRSEVKNLTFEWDSQTNDEILEFLIKIDNSPGRTVSHSSTSFTYDGLTAGTTYNNIKITAVIKTDRGNVSVDSNIITSDSTKPGQPGELYSNNTYDTNSTINIWFSKPTEGDADTYYIVIKNEMSARVYNDNTSTIPARVPANTLQPGMRYTIHITAIYNNKFGPEYWQNFRTLSKGSRSVQNLGTSDVTSRNLTVMWSYPQEDNGNLTAYILYVKRNNQCLQKFRYFYPEHSLRTPLPQEDVSCSESKDVFHNLRETVSQVIVELLPYSVYTLEVFPYNDAGAGDMKDVEQQTLIEVAGQPMGFTEYNVTTQSFILKWAKPSIYPGPTNYTIQIFEQKSFFENEATHVLISETLIGYEQEEFVYKNATSYWLYKATIFAETDEGKSAVMATPNFQTLESEPGFVSSLSVTNIEDIFTDAMVTWTCPNERDRHGKIIGYVIESVISGEASLPKTIPVSQEIDCSFQQKVKVTPSKNTTITVYASTENFKGSRKSQSYVAPVGPPLLPSPDTVVVQNTVKANTDKSIVIDICRNCLIDSSNGVVLETALIVCLQSACSIDTNISPQSLANMKTYKQSKMKGFQFPYRVTIDTWLDSSSDEYIEFTIGSETDCDNKEENVICNGPLLANTAYQFIAVSCSSAGCSNTRKLGPLKTAEEPTSGALVPAVVSVAVILVIVGVIAAVLFYRRRRKPAEPDLCELDEPTSPINDIPRNRPIKINNFEDQLLCLQKDSNLLFSEEFEGIGELSPKHSCEAASLEENKLKNRYVNILPFDHSRVKLLPIDDDDTTDYINANYIPGYKSQREYIATQGALECTINDFWRMIWEQRVAIIVMLSDLQEKGRPKVDKYWKDQNEPHQYGDIIVELTSVSVLNKYTIKIFELKLGDETRKVRHFFLPGWEDYRANLKPEDVLEFLSVVRQEVKPIDKGPMVVHCSAGVGRTGTFIALDIYQQYINDRDMSGTIDIYDLVLRMRNFRQSMVQSEKQYIFIHETVNEIIKQRKRKLEENDNEVIYENTKDHVYSNEAFESDDIYMNVENGKPTTVL